MNKTCLKDIVLPYEQDPTRGHSFPTPRNGITHQKEEPGTLDELEIRHVIHLPETKTKNTFPVQPLFTCPAQGKTRRNLIRGQEQEDRHRSKKSQEAPKT
jgi:hypothetical protein